MTWLTAPHLGQEKRPGREMLTLERQAPHLTLMGLLLLPGQLGHRLDPLSHRADGLQVVGLNRQHRPDVIRGYPCGVALGNLLAYVTHRGIRAARNRLNRLTPVLLSQALQIEEFPFDDTLDPRVPQAFIHLGRQVLPDVAHSIGHHVGNPLACSPPSRLLPQQDCHQSEEERGEQPTEGNRGEA